MREKIILLSDHTWFAVYDKEQAQKFVNHHFKGDGSIAFPYGIYIDLDSNDKCQTILYKE